MLLDELFGVIEETKLHFQQSLKKVPPKQKSCKPEMEAMPLYWPRDGGVIKFSVHLPNSHDRSRPVWDQLLQMQDVTQKELQWSLEEQEGLEKECDWLQEIQYGERAY